MWAGLRPQGEKTALPRSTAGFKGRGPLRDEGKRSGRGKGSREKGRKEESGEINS